MRVLFLHATFVKPGEIVKTVKKEFGIDITVHSAEYYKRHEDYKKTIQVMREKWGNELLEVELCNKRRRIEELEKIYKHSFDTDQMKNALAALYQIKGEVEKDLQQIGSQTNYQINIYKDMTELELEEERVKSLERLKTLKQIPEQEVIEVKEIKDA